MNRVRIGYFGDGPWAHRALEALLAEERVKVVFVCGRWQSEDEVLAAMAREAGIPFWVHPRINTGEFGERVANAQTDLLVSMSFNQIFRQPLLNLPRIAAINCHAGKLPFYRGRNILNWALINDEREFGVTVHHIDEGVDTGDIILQETLPITDEDDYGTLLERAYPTCAELVRRAVLELAEGSAQRVPQASLHPVGSYCCGRGPGDEQLDWNQSSRDVFNFVRALRAPGPWARCSNRGEEMEVRRVEEIPEAPIYKGIPGAVLAREAGGFLVKTADSLVRLADWSGGGKLRVGDRLQ